jgi:hypothetical protein
LRARLLLLPLLGLLVLWPLTLLLLTLGGCGCGGDLLVLLLRAAAVGHLGDVQPLPQPVADLPLRWAELLCQVTAEACIEQLAEVIVLWLQKSLSLPFVHNALGLHQHQLMLVGQPCRVAAVPRFCVWHAGVWGLLQRALGLLHTRRVGLCVLHGAVGLAPCCLQLAPRPLLPLPSPPLVLCISWAARTLMAARVLLLLLLVLLLARGVRLRIQAVREVPQARWVTGRLLLGTEASNDLQGIIACCDELCGPAGP